MPDAILKFIDVAIATSITVVALIISLADLNTTINQLQIAKVESMGDVVFVQDNKYSENNTAVDASIVRGSIVTDPVCKIIVTSDAMSVSYTKMSDGSYVVVEERLNQAPGVDSKSRKLVASSAELKLSWLIGKYRQKEVYDTTGQLDSVVYEKEN